MILIAHRGNIDGPELERENNPEYINIALDRGFDVEIDVWYHDERWYLGHDKPQYEVGIHWLKKEDRLWVHCKDYKTLAKMMELRPHAINFFYHTNEDYILTSQGIIWAFPDKPGGNNTICVMPELNNSSVDGFCGICSDYIGKYKDD